MVDLAVLRCDVTPPLGHPLCGGWIPPATEIVDSLWANGLVLVPEGQPAVVIVALDWCEIRNEGHDRWREAIARAAGTAPDRVAVQCVHPHDAPFCDPEAERLLRERSAPGCSMDLEFFDAAAARVARAAGAALQRLEPVTEVGVGQARVAQVASNRRIVGADGKVGPMRGSSCRDAALRAAPEGVIDPFLKTVSFWNGEQLLAAVHSYATHPMSHYGKGGVSCDFCGLARDRLAEETGAPQVYLTGCAGNVGAGKYNDGSAEMRPVLAERILAGMRESLASTRHQSLERVGWSTLSVRLPTRAEFTQEYYRDLLDDPSNSHRDRYRGATGQAWLKRVGSGRAINFGYLSLNDARVLFLPGEPFVEYQLFAQQLRPDLLLLAAGYGDCGPGYIPTAPAYEEGGYEAGWAALVGPEADPVMRAALDALLGSSDG